jgi:hypothetical protein
MEVQRLAPLFTYIIETSQVTHIQKMWDALTEIYGEGRFEAYWLDPNECRIKVTTHDPQSPWERLRAMGMVCQALQIDGGIVIKVDQIDD